MRSWTEQIRARDRNRKALEKAKVIRARTARRNNRKHMLEHPLSHAIATIRGR